MRTGYIINTTWKLVSHCVRCDKVTDYRNSIGPTAVCPPCADFLFNGTWSQHNYGKFIDVNS